MEIEPEIDFIIACIILQRQLDHLAAHNQICIASEVMRVFHERHRQPGIFSIRYSIRDRIYF